MSWVALAIAVLALALGILAILEVYKLRRDVADVLDVHKQRLTELDVDVSIARRRDSHHLG